MSRVSDIDFEIRSVEHYKMGESSGRSYDTSGPLIKALIEAQIAEES